MKFYRWSSLHENGFCVVKDPNIDDWELDDGISQINKHPDDAYCRMSPNFPDEIRLGDNLYGSGLTIISLSIKETLERLITSNHVEYLPLSIINHKGRLATKDYFILHPLDFCDCIDYDKSGIEWNSIDPSYISFSKGLILRNEIIPDDFILFRLKHWGSNIILRGDLAEMLLKENFTGLWFPDIEGYTGIG